jgi:hypothetical protein
LHCPALVLVPSADCSEAKSRLSELLRPFVELEGFGSGGNPLGRFDWYAIGGRFITRSRSQDCWPVRKLPKYIPGLVRHLVEPSGEWHDVDAHSCWPSGPVGRRTGAGWTAEVTEVLSAYPDHHAVLVDLHH